jgi:sulfopyruvate decarboxylase subunit alpha
MFTGPEIVAVLEDLGITHVVCLPDSTTGPWEAALESSPRLKLIRICREGEAWPLAAGLWLGGHSPLVIMQTTGLFESGDALRNAVYDLQVPVFALIGVRNELDPHSRDSAKTFAEPILRAWGLDFVWIRSAEDKPVLTQHYRHCRATQRAGAVVLAE